MHKKAMKMIEDLCKEIEGVGLDNISDDDLMRAKAFSTIANNMAQIDYNVKIIDEMEKAEYGKDYGEDGPIEKKYYRGQPRDSRGRYMSRMYTEPVYRMSPDQYREWERDMDRDKGKMYYTEPGGNMSSSSSIRNYGNGMSNNDATYGKSHIARKRYYEAVDTQDKMKKLEEYMHELTDDVMDMVKDATPEEKKMLKNKMTVLASKF